MNILVTGNMGYIGPAVVRQLRASHPHATLIGLDIGYFAHCLLQPDILPECYVDQQYFCDVRSVRQEFFHGIDAVVHLAGISNDPMGHAFEAATLSINHQGTINLATQAKAGGVKAFICASSCSVYGYAESGARSEGAALNPLTAYARSKVLTEQDLKTLADSTFQVTCPRFATACGLSDRLRLDLVLNDFVAGAIAHGKISILSDGTPWRPLIAIRDMARAIDWAIQRDPKEGGNYLVINIGSNEWNYQVLDLAKAVATVIPEVEIVVNKSAAPDKRSYRVSYDLFKQLAPNHQPQSSLTCTIRELKEGLERGKFSDPHYRESSLVRLVVLRDLRARGLLTEDLSWAFKDNRPVSR
jgi:nucleoside-diphosphate-sugar epimerase